MCVRCLCAVKAVWFEGDEVDPVSFPEPIQAERDAGEVVVRAHDEVDQTLNGLLPQHMQPRQARRDHLKAAPRGKATTSTEKETATAQRFRGRGWVCCLIGGGDLEPSPKHLV